MPLNDLANLAFHDRHLLPQSPEMPLRQLNTLLEPFERKTVVCC